MVHILGVCFLPRYLETEHGLRFCRWEQRPLWILGLSVFLPFKELQPSELMSSRVFSCVGDRCYWAVAPDPWAYGAAGGFGTRRGYVGEVTGRRLLGRVSILLAYERFMDSNVDQTTFRFGFPEVSQNPSVGLSGSQVWGHWLSRSAVTAAARCTQQGARTRKY